MKQTCLVDDCRYPTTKKVPLCPKHRGEEKKRARQRNKPDKAWSFSERVGCVYVVAFSTGYVKVGVAGDPDKRIATHQRQAWSIGVDVTSTWVSEPMHYVRAVESDLVKWCVANSSERRAKEYFRGLDYQSAVDQAKQLIRLHVQTDVGKKDVFLDTR